MSKRMRQYIGILAAIAAYYVVHEGAHFVAAVCFGAFRQIRFMGIGMQVDVYAEKMTDLQMGIMNLAGAVSTWLFAWLLIALKNKICQVKSPVFRAAAYYMTITMLFLDPVYLSVLCGFFGGGDMNGIALLMPETAARALFGAVGILHIFVFWKLVLPAYRRSFRS
ncbi:MAG: hypothetical protein ACI4MF_03265 [Candidatus Faecivicinus sp.]